MRSTLVLALSLVVACGGSTTPPIGTSDASTTDAAADAPLETGTDAGGCVQVSQEGTPCTTGQKSCDRVDLCCASAFECMGGTWKLQGQACLLCQSHPCADKTCTGNQMCIIHESGVPNGTPTGECAPYPTECARKWTCNCVTKNLPGGCTLSPKGCTDSPFPVTVSCMGI